MLYQNALSPRDKMLYTAMQYVRTSGLKGDYFEFGVYKGSNLIAAYHIAQRYLSDMNFYAFDSFEGLPEGDEVFEKGQFSCTEKEVIFNLKKKKVDLSKIKIVAGWFNETLKGNFPPIAIAYIDCDLYESTVTVLEFLAKYLENGALVIFDEWFAYRSDPKKGEQKAFQEWLTKNPRISAIEYQKFGWSGNSFIIHKS